MSELLSVWNSSQLGGATPPPPFNIPNNPNAVTLKINNQSRYWLYISQTSTGVNVDRIEPFSYLIVSYEPDLTLSIDQSGDAIPVSSLNPDLEFVDYSVLTGNGGIIEKGSTAFSGETPSTINNKQIATTQIYSGQTTIAITAGASNYTEYINFLPNDLVDQVQSGNIYIKSKNGNNYTLATVLTNMIYSDGSLFTPQSFFDVSSSAVSGTTTAYFDGMNTALCNQLQLGLTVPIFTGNDTITVYWQINANSTAVEVVQGQGVPVRPTHNHLTDASGTITTANTSQQVLSDIPEGDGYREYVFLQNLDTTNNLYVNFGSAATTGAGSIVLSPGESLTFESSFCPGNTMNVLSTVAGVAYTCKTCEIVWAHG